MKNKSFQMGFEIKTSSGEFCTPTQFTPWKKDSEFSDYTPTATLKYMNDALIGMNFHVLNGFKSVSNEDKKFVSDYLKHIDPYFEIFKNSSNRLNTVYKKSEPLSKKIVQDFESHFSGFLDKCFSEQGINLKFMSEGLNAISEFEKNFGSALIYNFNVQFSNEFNQKLISFYSFLFHLRTVVAMNHNNQVVDSAFETVKCDSISDYLPKTDFTVNDGLIYWQFKKLATPFVGQSDVRVEKLLVNPLEQAFQKFNHNACALINNLPESFLTYYSAVQLEESLHQIQVDWLLGSSCGLLFRLREELFGLTEGYNKIFWPEATDSNSKKNVSLKFCFELFESDFISIKKAG